MSNLVYVIGQGFDHPVKIGVASDITRRLAALQSGNPDELRVMWSIEHPEPFALEAHLHRTFDATRVRGEWFLVPGLESILAAIAGFSGTAVPRQSAGPSSACAAAARWMIDAESRRTGALKPSAVKSLVERHSGLTAGLLWAFSYRPPQSVDTEQYFWLVTALWAEARLEPFGPLSNAPYPAEVLACVDRLKSEPLPAADCELRPYVSRAERALAAVLGTEAEETFDQSQGWGR